MDIEGKKSTVETIFTGKYKLNDSNLKMHYENVLIRKKHRDDHINKTQILYKGLSIKHKVTIIKNNLYFSSSDKRAQSESYNYICKEIH
ncbi:hypothetical protein [Vibrio coralliilyticus]|uniref:hypothetical protein n=1 Tax=Vibrio coralliilyticus TaxID=190893 RepID=UPI001560AC89|nr:hypothetical protein [Vibrio coralliilyticus]NRF12897.1 hypothetical protein [Vibrio coralliilyticus]